jgi:HAD superfamily hydrolase (TIGR01662 family)
MPRRIRAVLFDVGGTLVDDRDFGIWTDLARRVYLDLDPDALAHAYADVEQEVDRVPPAGSQEEAKVEFWRRVLSEASGQPLEARIAQAFLAAEREEERPARLFSDVRRCLEGLKRQRRRLAVVSNSTSEASIRRLLDRVGVLSYFQPILSSGTEGVRKPDPEIFRRAVARLGLRPDEALYVGDLANTDARGAVAAGLHSVWLNRGGTGLGSDPPEITSLLEVRLVIRGLEAAPSRSPRGTP